MNIVIVRCDVCREKVAKVDTDTLHLPLTAEQFGKLGSGRIEHPPFRDTEPRWWTCPVCGKRPFNDPTSLMTDTGRISVADKKVEGDGEAMTGTNDDFPEHLTKPPYYDDHKKIFEKMGEAAAETVLNVMKDVALTCPNCGKVCGSKIGLISHIRTHK